MDFCIPNNNEEDFIELAEKLNIEQLIFVYKNKESVKKIKSFKTALLVKPKEVVKFRKFADYIIVKSSDDDRFALEKSKPDFMFGFEFLAKKDFMHQRASGLNEVFCKLAKKNKITLLFPFSDFLACKKKSLILGRLMQNKKLCKKYGVELRIVSFAKHPYQLRNVRDLNSFFKIL